MVEIWKYGLVLQEQQTLIMPKGAKILTVQMQGKYPMLWAVVDPMAGREQRVFQVVGTGNSTPPEVVQNYVGTWQEGSCVWHLFEVTL